MTIDIGFEGVIKKTSNSRCGHNYLNDSGVIPIPMPEVIETPNRPITPLLSEIKRGIIRVPDFQREYIWQINQVVELLDSVWNGYPIGSILLWETSEELKERDPLNLKLEELSRGIRRQYLLDGQQRLVTLYAVLHNILELGKKRKTKYSVYFDLKSEQFYIYTKKDLEDGKADPKIE